MMFYSLIFVLIQSLSIGQNNYPMPFVQTGYEVTNPDNSPAVSSGYYFTTSDQYLLQSDWKVVPTIKDTINDSTSWIRILSGPKQKPLSYWSENLDLGTGYFRNPNNQYDSTDNAIAGPIPIGFKFVFNGMEYDSFYVSSNGSIALTNCRYYYASNGQRETRKNDYSDSTAYNTFSSDWFIRTKRKGDGIADTVPDNFGWLSVVGSGQNAGLLSSQSAWKISNDNKIAMISPFQGNGFLSQYYINRPNDVAKVYYNVNKTGKELIIYIVNFRLKDTLRTPMGNVYLPNAMYLGENENGYVSANVQIKLRAADSTISFHFEKFSGQLTVNGIKYGANEIFQYNTDCGLYGFARHKSFDSKVYVKNPDYKGTLPWGGEYNQYSEVWNKADFSRKHIHIDNFKSIKFKQWKNTLRVVSVNFVARRQKENSPDFSEEIPMSKSIDFEILAGHEQIGQVQPVAIVQNLTNDVQGLDGVNYQSQDISFRVRCAIVNQVTRRPLYNKYTKVDSLILATKYGEAALEKLYLSKVDYFGLDYSADTLHKEYYDKYGKLKNFNGIPPYAYVKVYFPPFEPNDLFKTHIGQMKAFVMVDPTNPKNGESLKDMWKFDDTMGVRFWTMRHIPETETFIDDGTEFHVVSDKYGNLTAIPSVYKWVNIGAESVTGEDISDYPLPPRDSALCENKELYPNFKLKSPVIKMDRPASVAPGEWGGDEIRSYPMDMHQKPGSVLTLSVQRTRKRESYNRGWSDELLVGPEHRVVKNTWYNPITEPDELRVEFAKSTPNWKDGTGITNIPEENWRYHPRRKGAAPETNMSAYTIFGGGGYMVGFLETDRDSALAPPVYQPSGLRAPNGLRYEISDCGIDYDFKSYYIPIPDTFIRAGNEGAKYFRFRVKLNAKNHQQSNICIPDDNDEWFVDDIRILNANGECIDIRITKSYIQNVNKLTPASQAIAMPVRMQLMNNTPYQAPSFWVKTLIVPKKHFDELYFLNNSWIYKGNKNDEYYDYMIELFKEKNQIARDSARWQLYQKTVYCRIKQLWMLRPGAQETITMPNFNARSNPPGEYVCLSLLYVPGGDEEPTNDTTYSYFKVNYGPIMSLIGVQNTSQYRNFQNDVSESSGIPGRGLHLPAYSKGGLTNKYLQDWEIGGLDGESEPGEIAIKFELFQEDTLFGYGAFVENLSAEPNYIEYRLYNDKTLPKDEIQGSHLIVERSYDDLLKDYVYGKVQYNLLEKPLKLPKGYYWISVKAQGSANLNLAASKTDVGMRTTVVSEGTFPNEDANGNMGRNYFINPNYINRDVFGSPVNHNFFAYKNQDSNWKSFSPTNGNPAYAHLNYMGLSPKDNQTNTYSRGTWNPLIFPYFGNRAYSSTYNYQDCTPVELLSFSGFSRKGENDLYWETASEIDNYGFYIEKKVNDGNWNTMSTFIPGFGTSNIQHDYNYTDEDVKHDEVYYYRLRQVDLDGTQTDDDFSGVVRLCYQETLKEIVLDNSPNPATELTVINYKIPSEKNIKLEIYDLQGNLINTLIDEIKSAGEHKIIWKLNDSKNKKVSTGVYIIKLTVGMEVLTRKMIINSGF